MQAIGKHISIEKLKEAPVYKTDGGLLPTQSQRQDGRYKKAKVINCGDQLTGVKEVDSIFYYKHAGHRIEIGDDAYYVIRFQDVVIVL